MFNKITSHNGEIKLIIEGLLELISAELNLKQIFLSGRGLISIYSFDTLNNKAIGIDENWPVGLLFFTGDIVSDMEEVRKICTIGHTQRTEAKIPVRQPLQSMTIYIK